MSRIGATTNAFDLWERSATADPWVSLLTADNTEPGQWEARGPRCLRLWATRGFQGITKGFRARVVFGAGDVSYQFPIGSAAGSLVLVPTQGLALPMPDATSVRVDVAMANPSLPPTVSFINATITHGAPVLTWMGGGMRLGLGAVDTITLDPEDYPFAAILRVTNVGVVLGATVQFATGAAFQMPVNSTFDFPFTSTVILTSVVGAGVVYSVGIIS